MEIKSDRKGAAQFAPLSNLHKIVDSTQQIQADIESILFTRPLPFPNLLKELDLFANTSTIFVYNLFKKLNDYQEIIREVRLAWDDIPPSEFQSSDEKTHFHSALVRQGLFRKLVMNRVNNVQVNIFLLESLQNPRICQLRNYRHILQRWVAPFQVRHNPYTDVEMDNTVILNERELRSKGKKSTRMRLDRKLVFSNVEAQKKAIVEAMRRQDYNLMQKFINELIDYQLKHAGKERISKSLCDIAMEAKKLGMYSLQKQLTEKSVDLNPDDGWAWAQYADALLKNNLLDLALRAYEEASLFGQRLIAKNGRAEVLKALNRLDEALAAYDAVMEDYSGDIVAKSGRAEVLKALNRLDEALAAYDAVIEEYPEGMVAKSGRAEVLKALNRLDEALAAYDAVIEAHPESMVAKKWSCRGAQDIQSAG